MSNVVGVLIDGMELLRSVVVVDPDLLVVRSDDNPLFAGDPTCRTNWRVAYLEAFH